MAVPSLGLIASGLGLCDDAVARGPRALWGMARASAGCARRQAINRCIPSPVRSSPRFRAAPPLTRAALPISTTRAAARGLERENFGREARRLKQRAASWSEGLKMNFEKYTERARGFVQSAQSLATREGHQQFTPEHILKVLLDDEQGLSAGPDRPRRRPLARGAGEDRSSRSPNCPRCWAAGAGQLYLAPTTARAFRQRREDRPEGGRFLRHRRAAAAGAGDGEGLRGRERFLPTPA